MPGGFSANPPSQVLRRRCLEGFQGSHSLAGVAQASLLCEAVQGDTPLEEVPVLLATMHWGAGCQRRCEMQKPAERSIQVPGRQTPVVPPVPFTGKA